MFPAKKKSGKWSGREGDRKKDRKHELKLHLRRALLCEKHKMEKHHIRTFLAKKDTIIQKGGKKER